VLSCFYFFVLNFQSKRQSSDCYVRVCKIASWGKDISLTTGRGSSRLHNNMAFVPLLGCPFVLHVCRRSLHATTTSRGGGQRKTTEYCKQSHRANVCPSSPSIVLQLCRQSWSIFLYFFFLVLVFFWVFVSLSGLHQGKKKNKRRPSAYAATCHTRMRESS